jgi:hypothetical protein
MPREGLLQGREFSVWGQAFNRRNRRAVDLYGVEKTGSRKPAIN